MTFGSSRNTDRATLPEYICRPIFRALHHMEFVTYQERHIGPNADETKEMLAAIGVGSMDELIQRTIPKGIRLGSALDVGEPLTEQQHLDYMKRIGAKN